MADLETHVPDITVTPQGLVIPEVAEVLAGVLNDMNDAFGGNLNIQNVATPQGLLAADITYNIALKNAAFAYLTAMLDPSSAQGRWLDAIGQIYFIQRKAATATTVTAECTGIPGYTLPAGSLAKDDEGYVYASSAAARFGAGGTVDVTFVCQTLGAIPCAARSLNQIQTAVPGWDAITNLNPGVMGSDQESDRAFEQRRYDSVSKNASGSIAALMGAVASLDNVVDVYVTENNTNLPVSFGETSYVLAPHSVYVAVVGGDDQEIAETIFMRKNAGSNMNGNTTVTVQDKSSYVYPYPSYQIKFNRPTATPIYFIVNISQNENLPADVVEQAQQAVMDVLAGEGTAGRARIGGTIYASTYYGPVSDISDFINILSIYIGTTENASSTAVSLGIDQVPVVSADQITVNLVE